jgi:hypothetical protein
MILRTATLDAIRRGEVSLAFRRWRRPTVKTGGTLLTAIGQLAIDDVRQVSRDEITEEDARCAGHASREALLADLDTREEGDIYRVTLGAVTADPRVALRERAAGDDELEALAARLARLDGRSTAGPWTRATLEIIEARPEVRAGDLATSLGRPRDDFKVDVRKLKALGLTESLEVGYRLSPRGAALLRHLRRR